MSNPHDPLFLREDVPASHVAGQHMTFPGDVLGWRFFNTLDEAIRPMCLTLLGSARDGK